MIFNDFAATAHLWSNGTVRKQVKVDLIPEEKTDPAQVQWRSGWAGYAFSWNTFCINALLFNNREYERGWGFHVFGSNTFRVELPREAVRFKALAAIHNWRETGDENHRLHYDFLDTDGTVLAAVDLKYGESCPVDFALANRKTFDIRITSNSEDRHPVLLLEPEIRYADGTVELCGTKDTPECTAGLSFKYDGVPFDPALWEHTVQETGSGKFLHTWFSPDRKLKLQVTAQIYEDLHVVEWTPRLATAGNEKTGLVEDFLSLDMEKFICETQHNDNNMYLSGASILAAGVKLHRQLGSQAAGTDFTADTVVISNRYTQRKVVMDNDEGRSSAAWMPFFQLELANNRRIDVAIGWSGAWVGSVEFTGNESFRTTVGLRKTSFRLNPGEEIMQPEIALHYAVAGKDECSNEFRRYMNRHRLPRNSKGELIPPPTSVMFSGTMPNGMLMKYIDLFTAKSLPVDVIWVDAGWYGPDREVPLELHLSDWPLTVGDWRVNQIPHPGGFRPVTDELHKRGMKFLLWLETERATDHAAITSEHPEYFIPAGGGNYMLDLGNREACDYAIETVSKVLQEEGVDCYREDFNFNTIPAWEEADSRAPDRTGMAESLFITGFYRFWETLRERFPDLLIDNCASGGRRIDLMTSSLGIPMWRSDFQCFTIIPYLAEANQIHFDGLSRWLPYHACGTVVKDGDDYAFLSGALGATLIDVCNRLLFLPEENAFDFNWLRKMLEISKRMRQYISEDYYPLTEHPEDFRNYYAAEIIDPAAGAGWVAIFRRAACTADSISLQLKGIEPAAEYTVETYPETPVRTVKGSELAAMTVQMPEPRSCKVIFFRKK